MNGYILVKKSNTLIALITFLRRAFDNLLMGIVKLFFQPSMQDYALSKCIKSSKKARWPYGARSFGKALIIPLKHSTINFPCFCIEKNILEISRRLWKSFDLKINNCMSKNVLLYLSISYIYLLHCKSLLTLFKSEMRFRLMQVFTSIITRSGAFPQNDDKVEKILWNFGEARKFLKTLWEDLFSFQQLVQKIYSFSQKYSVYLYKLTEMLKFEDCLRHLLGQQDNFFKNLDEKISKKYQKSFKFKIKILNPIFVTFNSCSKVHISQMLGYTNTISIDQKHKAQTQYSKAFDSVFKIVALPFADTQGKNRRQQSKSHQKDFSKIITAILENIDKGKSKKGQKLLKGILNLSFLIFNEGSIIYKSRKLKQAHAKKNNIFQCRRHETPIQYYSKNLGIRTKIAEPKLIHWHWKLMLSINNLSRKTIQLFCKNIDRESSKLLIYKLINQNLNRISKGHSNPQVSQNLKRLSVKENKISMQYYSKNPEITEKLFDLKTIYHSRPFMIKNNYHRKHLCAVSYTYKCDRKSIDFATVQIYLNPFQLVNRARVFCSLKFEILTTPLTIRNISLEGHSKGFIENPLSSYNVGKLLSFKIKTPSANHAHSLLGVISFARLFAANETSPGLLNEGTMNPQKAAALFFANVPEQDGEYLTFRVSSLDEDSIALLFEMFSVYSSK
jgi:hypothetical protein